MNHDLRPTEALLCGIRRSAGVDGVDLDQTPLIVEDEACWALRALLRIASRSEFVPEESKWIILVDKTYPRGKIRVFPAKDGGLAATFPHQEQNRPGPPTRPWRDGKLCLDRPVDRLGLVAGRVDPVGNADERIRWHLLRTLEWLRLASVNDLIAPGDPFELPWCGVWKEGDRRVHDECGESYHAWEALSEGSWGVVVWDELPSFKDTRCAAVFEDQRGSTVRRGWIYSADRHGPERTGRQLGFWWLWASPIVVPPWHCPSTWGELRRAGEEQGIDVDNVLRDIVRRARGVDGATLLLGYPMPLRWGEAGREVHWQAISLPVLAASGRPADGFRANELGWWMRDRREVLGGNSPVHYVRTENWHAARLLARGRLADPVRSARVALLGCGALGSAVAEILVRGGVTNVLLLDGDLFLAGNLVRHILTGADIGRGKAEALAERLRAILPMATIKAHPGSVPVEQGKLERMLENVDIVLDCTATDEVPLSLSEAWWSVPRLFVSASTGYKARRTFLYSCFGNTFDNETFVGQISPWLQEERELWVSQGETLEGVGCWSPLFPARFDDVLVAAAVCVKAIEMRMRDAPRGPELLVYEEEFEDGDFKSLRRIAVTATGERQSSPDPAT